MPDTDPLGGPPAEDENENRPAVSADEEDPQDTGKLPETFAQNNVTPPEADVPGCPCVSEMVAVVAEENAASQSQDETPFQETPPAPNEALLLELKSLMGKLAKDFEIKFKYDADKKEQIDKLYDENRQYKDGIFRDFRNTMVRAVIEQIDDAAKQIAFFENAEFTEKNYQKVLRSYRDIAESFQDLLLDKFDVENYQGRPGDPFDPKKQRALKTVPTGNPDGNRTVSQTLRPGYLTAEGQVLRPELVEVYVFDEALARPPAIPDDVQEASPALSEDSPDRNAADTESDGPA